MARLRGGRSCDVLGPICSLGLIGRVFRGSVPSYFVRGCHVIRSGSAGGIVRNLRFAFVRLPGFAPRAFVRGQVDML